VQTDFQKCQYQWSSEEVSKELHGTDGSDNPDQQSRAGIEEFLSPTWSTKTCEIESAMK